MALDKLPSRIFHPYKAPPLCPPCILRNPLGDRIMGYQFPLFHTRGIYSFTFPKILYGVRFSSFMTSQFRTCDGEESRFGQSHKYSLSASSIAQVKSRAMSAISPRFPIRFVYKTYLGHFQGKTRLMIIVGLRDIFNSETVLVSTFLAGWWTCQLAPYNQESFLCISRTSVSRLQKVLAHSVLHRDYLLAINLDMYIGQKMRVSIPLFYHWRSQYRPTTPYIFCILVTLNDSAIRMVQSIRLVYCQAFS